MCVFKCVSESGSGSGSDSEQERPRSASNASGSGSGSDSERERDDDDDEDEGQEGGKPSMNKVCLTDDTEHTECGFRCCSAGEDSRQTCCVNSSFIISSTIWKSGKDIN